MTECFYVKSQGITVKIISNEGFDIVKFEKLISPYYQIIKSFSGEVYFTVCLPVCKQIRIHRDSLAYEIPVVSAADLTICFETGVTYLCKSNYLEIFTNTDFELELLQIVRSVFVEIMGVSCVKHMALIDVEGTGVAIIGEKNQGKTTTLLSLLYGIDKSKYVSNDKVLFGLKNKVYGIPQAISINPDTNALYNISSHEHDRYIGGKVLKHPFTLFKPSKICESTDLYLSILPSLYEGNSARILSSSTPKTEKISFINQYSYLVHGHWIRKYIGKKTCIYRSDPKSTIVANIEYNPRNKKSRDELVNLVKYLLKDNKLNTKMKEA